MHPCLDFVDWQLVGSVESVHRLSSLILMWVDLGLLVPFLHLEVVDCLHLEVLEVGDEMKDQNPFYTHLWDLVLEESGPELKVCVVSFAILVWVA